MSTSKDEFVKIISKENSSDFQSWEPPNMNDNQKDNFDTGMPTADALEQLNQQAYTEGFEEGKLEGIKNGFEKGEKEGIEQGKKKAYDETLKDIETKVSYFEKLYSALKDPLLQTNEEVEKEITQLAILISEHVIEKEIKNSPEIILKLVKKSLNLLPSAAKEIIIYLNAKDLAIVKDSFDLLLENNSNHDYDKLRIVEDSKIAQGGCIVDSTISHIDATIEKRFKELFEKILPDLDYNEDKINNESTDNSDKKVKEQKLKEQKLEENASAEQETK